MLIFDQAMQERMLTFVSNYLRVLNTKEPASITDEEYLMEMEAHAIIKKINDNR